MSAAERSMLFASLGLILWSMDYKFQSVVTWIISVTLLAKSLEII